MKLVRLFVITCLVLLGTVGWAAAQIQTIPLTSDPSSLELVRQDDAGLTYRVQVGSLEAMNVTTREGAFTRVMIPGFYRSYQEGAPELPMMNRLFEIPYGAATRVEIVSQSSRIVDLADYGLTNRLFPAQPPMSKSADPATVAFVYDRSTYEVSRVARNAAVTEVGTLRSVRLGRLELSPVEYEPSTNRLIVHDQMEVRIHFDGADRAREAELKAATYSPFFEGLYERIDGYRGQHDLHPDLVRDVVTMAIVVPPQYEAQMQTFINWKRTRGFKVIVGVTGTPEVGTTTTSIDAWLTNLYNNGTPTQPAPSFILFVGDTDVMPTWIQSGDCTDRLYGCIDADLIPEMYYGRFSCSNASNLQAMIDKTLMYDQFTMPDPSYLGKAVMIAGVDGSYGQVWANGQINYGTSTYFNAAHGIAPFIHLYPASGSQDAQIVQEVSDGVGYVNYTAHGSETAWYDPSFTQANVNSLQNANKYCMAVGNCCLTSDYDYSSECLAETWLRAANKGAIGYIGGSNSTYWDEDYYWGVGYRASIVEHPTFDAAHMGAYDGMFHDHSEPMTKWYVTNDAFVFCGNLAVTESGSSRITYYWNIYNLMGDPSLSAYLGVPTANPVTHPTTIFTTWTSINVTAAPNSYVGLTRNGTLLGAGTTDAAGNLALPIFAQPLTPGPAHLCVTAQNRQPYQANVNVIVPAVVQINPNVIDANVPTVIDVAVFEYDGVTPKPGIDIWASGLQYESAHATTGVNGHATLNVTYAYGPTLDIVGKNPAETWELFRVPINVNAGVLNRPDLWVTTDIGMDDSFALNLPGVLHVYCQEPGYTLHAFLNGTPAGSTGDTELTLTPTATGTMSATIAVSGYDLYTEEFPVVEAFGTLAGHVDANGSPAVGAVVRGYDGEGEVAFQTTTNASGNYAITDDILCALYTIKVDFFGYLHFEQPFFVNYGANTYNITLAPAPAGVITGVVTEDGTGLPLDATIKIYRTDTGELYTQAVTDPLTGVYTTAALPYFDWRMVARAYHHSPVTRVVTVDEPSETQDFALVPTIGDLLIIDNDAAKRQVPDKIDEKTGAVIEPGYFDDRDKAAAANIRADLEEAGYNVTTEDLTSNPATWETYDLLIVSCGGNTSTLSAAIKTSLISYVNAGGHLLLEGGEVGYDNYSDTAFGTAVMHSIDWNHDSSGNVTNAAPAHYVMSVPNVIPNSITMTYAQYGDEDAMTPLADAVRVGSWSTYATDASIICYDPNPAPEGGAIVFFCFNYDAMDAAVRPLLLQNAVNWLLTPEAGNCSVAGTVELYGQTDHSGVKVEAIPNGGFVYTNAAGEYLLPGLFSGAYTIKASKQSWSIGQQAVTLTSGQELTGVDFQLTPVYQAEVCRQPNLAINDNSTVTDNAAVSIGAWASVTGVEVYVNITHTYIGDLLVKIRSPQATEVTLHNRTGSGTDNLIGWYPTEIAPYQSLNAFIGQPTDGNWMLTVADQAGGDTGMLNSWCVRIAYGGDPAAAPEAGLPATLALRAPQPNPARGAASLRFDLPQRSAVDLAVFDVSGRRVTTIVSGTVEGGSYQATWLGRGDDGRSVPSGVYFVRLHADGQFLTQRVMLMR